MADALSRHDADTISGLVVSVPSFDLLTAFRAAAAIDDTLCKLWERLDHGELGEPWCLVDELVTFHNRLYVPATFFLLSSILSATHNDNHEGVQRTLHRLRRDIHVASGRNAIQDFIRACVVCQRNKVEHLHPAGLLQPLPIPSAVWQDVSMDFIEALSKVGGKSVILTVVDRFSKYAHFIALRHPYSATSVARAFFDQIVRLHGIPCSIVSDWGPVFTSMF